MEEETIFKPEILVDAETETKGEPESAIEAYINENVWGPNGLIYQDKMRMEITAKECYNLAITDVLLALKEDKTMTNNLVIMNIENLMVNV